MLTLDTALQIPETVLFTMVDGEAVLLNTLTNQYFSLGEVGARIWDLLSNGRSLRAVHELLLAEYEIGTADLEQDILDLVGKLKENGLVELV